MSGRSGGSATGMAASGNEFVQVLRSLPAFSELDTVSLSRLVPDLEIVEFDPGASLVQAGEPVHSAFHILSGSVALHREGDPEVVSGLLVGEEASVGLAKYLRSADAVTPVRAVRIPAFLFRRHGVGGARGALYRTLAARLSPVSRVANPEQGESGTTAAPPPPRVSALTVLGWALTLILPAFILITADDFGFDWSQRHVLAALVACLVMWAFDLVPQYAAATIAVVGCLILGAVPTEVVLSGFGDEDLFMIFGVFAVGSVLVSSGITDRIILQVMKRTPETAFGYNTAFLLTGFILTPALPSANTRVELLAPLTAEASRNLGFKQGSREATRLFLSMFVGASIFAPIFLTSKSLNFIVYGMLPDQVSAEFHWLRWLSVTWPAALFMLVVYSAVTHFWFRGGTPPRLSRTHLNAQLATLGPMRTAEWIAIGSVIFFVFSLVTYSLHKISPFWVSFGVFLAFLLVGVLEKRHLDKDFDWGVILMIGFFIGLTQSLSYVGLTDLLSESLSVVTRNLRTNVEVSLLLLIGVISVARVFLPITTSGVVLCSLLIPLSASSGVNPWVVLFVTLLLNEAWLAPYQSSYYQAFEAASGGRAQFDRALFLKVNAMTVGLRILAAFFALQYMRSMDLL
jgi:divalent anion:Na+ symporter, DASS family